MPLLIGRDRRPGVVGPHCNIVGGLVVELLGEQPAQHALGLLVGHRRHLAEIGAQHLSFGDARERQGRTDADDTCEHRQHAGCDIRPPLRNLHPAGREQLRPGLRVASFRL